MTVQQLDHAGRWRASLGRALARFRLSRAAQREVAWALGAVLLATIAAILALRLWRGDLSVPLSYHGDALSVDAVIKAAVENGWYQHNSDLGAPLGQTFLDYGGYIGDHGQLGLLKLLTLVTSSLPVLVNVFFLLGFPLAALSAFLVFRVLGASRGPALVGAVLFAVLPYHFLRGEDHLFLTSYWGVPPACYLFLRALAGEALLTRERGRWLRGWATPRTVGSLAICLLLGLTGVYYATFAIILLLTAAVVTGMWRGARASLPALALIGAIAVILLANAAPNLIYRAKHGTNPEAGQRQVSESEYYGLKLADLVLPVQGHRVRALANLRGRYDATSLPQPSTEASFATLGLVGTIGFGWLLIFALGRLAGLRARFRSVHRTRYAGAAVGSIVLFGVGTVGGGSALIAYLISPQLHAWNRVSIFIAFLSLLAVALLLSGGLQRLRARGVSPALGWIGLALVLALGVADQTSDRFIPEYAVLAADYRSDHAFVTQIQHRLSRSAAVLQLPYEPFPEPPRAAGREGVYDPFRAYLNSTTLRWSYGQVKGRPADWQSRLEVSKPQRWLAAATVAGFSGVYVDRRGFDDGGQAIEAKLGRLVGRPLLVSRDARLAFFDVRQLGRRIRGLNTPHSLQAARTALLDPPRIFPGTNFGVQPGAPTLLAGAFTRAATVIVRNGLHHDRRLEFDAILSTDARTAMQVSVVAPDGRRSDHTVAPGRPLALGLAFNAPPGDSPISLAAAPREPLASTLAPPLHVAIAGVRDPAGGALRVG